MSRQTCETPDCTEPAVTYADDRFACEQHAPTGAVIAK